MSTFLNVVIAMGSGHVVLSQAAGLMTAGGTATPASACGMNGGMTG